jgi:hypothetical protein
MTMMKVDEFLNVYADIIFDEHKPEFLRFQPMTQSRNGLHYRSCLWFSDDAIDGPDTCECVKRNVVAVSAPNSFCHFLVFIL